MKIGVKIKFWFLFFCMVGLIGYASFTESLSLIEKIISLILGVGIVSGMLFYWKAIEGKS